MIWDYSRTFAHELAEYQRAHASIYEEAMKDLSQVVTLGPEDIMQVEMAKYTQQRAAERSASVRTMMGIAYTWNDTEVDACDDPLPLTVSALDGATVTDIYCDRRGYLVIRFDTDDGEAKISTLALFDENNNPLPLGDIRYADE